MFNRQERRAIDQGKGRIKPMIEVIDVVSAQDYAWELTSGPLAGCIFHNIARLFMSYQICYFDIRDEFDKDHCLYY